MKLIKKYYYKIFGKFIFYVETQKRKKANKKIKQYKLVKNFRELESALRGVKYPNNDFNKMMSVSLADIELFGHVVNRFYAHRQMLKEITLSDEFFRHLNTKARSYPAHPAENYVNNAIKIDTQSLFIFGMILVNRSLLLLKMYLPDKGKDQQHPMYDKIGNFYFALCGYNNLSPIAIKLRDNFLIKIKWLYSVLRFYRNEFIEHLDKGYQQGMNFGIYNNEFALSSYKWSYNGKDDEKIEKFRSKLEKRGVHITGRGDGGRSLINRYYIQRLFYNIVEVPNDLLKEALDLTEEVGVDSPQPAKIIAEIESYMGDLFNFMSHELDQSELAKYKEKL